MFMARGLVYSSRGLPLAALAGLELDDQGMVAQSHGDVWKRATGMEVSLDEVAP
jgi:hypothetical protein